jgi:hypothetical protein
MKTLLLHCLTCKTKDQENIYEKQESSRAEWNRENGLDSKPNFYSDNTTYNKSSFMPTNNYEIIFVFIVVIAALLIIKREILSWFKKS